MGGFQSYISAGSMGGPSAQGCGHGGGNIHGKGK